MLGWAQLSLRPRDVAASATQLKYTAAFSSRHLISTLWPWILISQVIQTATMISTCAPYLKQFLEAFPSGMFQSDELRRRGRLNTKEPCGYEHYSNESFLLPNWSKYKERQPRIAVRSGNQTAFLDGTDEESAQPVVAADTNADLHEADGRTRALE